MKKRIISLLTTIILLFSALSGRLYYLSVFPENVSADSGFRTKEIASTRGFIYDRNMTPVTKTDCINMLCINPSAKALDFLRKNNAPEEIIRQVQKGEFVIIKTPSPEKYKNCEDIKILKTYDKTTNNSLCHIIGYTDATGNGVCGIEKYYNDFLKNSGGTLSVTYSADARGRVMTGEDIIIKDNSYYGTGGILLTIDNNFQKITENAIVNGNIKKGACIVLDTNTNKILACASAPVYDKENLSDYINDENAPFINRAFSAFSVGSVFKTVTAATCLENDISLDTFNCTGKININGTVFNCNKKDGHGNINFNDALSKSCNSYFVNYGLKLTAEQIIKSAKMLHLGEYVDLGNGFKTSEGVLPRIEDCKNQGDIANLSFGQGKLSATPLQIAAIFSAIGNGGYYIEPILISGIVSTDGTVEKESDKPKEKVFQKNTCETLKNALSLTTVSGTGIAAHTENFICCTKTATAQSGQFDSNGEEINICWFVGFFPKENPQYTICVMKENGSSGGSDCGPIFKEIAENIYSISRTF